VRCAAIQFVVAAINQNELGHVVLSDWSQPRRTGSLHRADSVETAVMGRCVSESDVEYWRQASSGHTTTIVDQMTMI